MAASPRPAAALALDALAFLAVKHEEALGRAASAAPAAARAAAAEASAAALSERVAALEEERTALDSAMGAAADATRQCIEEQEQSVLEEWKNGDGIQVNENVDRESFAAAAEEAMLEQPWGDLYQQIKDRQ